MGIKEVNHGSERLGGFDKVTYTSSFLGASSMVRAEEYLAGILTDYLDDRNHAEEQGDTSVVVQGVGSDTEPQVALCAGHLWLAARWVLGS